MKTHPEQKPNEVFIGNRNMERELDYIDVQFTFRYGVNALDIDGNPITNSYVKLKPAFLDKKDLEKWSDMRTAHIRSIG